GVAVLDLVLNRRQRTGAGIIDHRAAVVEIELRSPGVGGAGDGDALGVADAVESATGGNFHPAGEDVQCAVSHVLHGEHAAAAAAGLVQSSRSAERAGERYIVAVGVDGPVAKAAGVADGNGADDDVSAAVDGAERQQCAAIKYELVCR